MGDFDRREAATRAGVTVEYVARLVELGIVSPERDRFSPGDVRTVQVIQALEQAGIDLEGLGVMVRGGALSLDFIDAAGYEVFSLLSDTTFADCSAQNGIPVELLTAIREVMGGAPARPEDLMREHELEVVPLIRLQVGEGFRPAAIERALRVYGDSLRRIAETEADWFRTEIVQPMLAAGQTENDVAVRTTGLSPRLSEVSARAILAVYHSQQRHAWSTNIIDGIAGALSRAGVQRRQERLPAMCFLDITGYTRLTAEQGDEAAAGLAERLTRLVQRTAVQHGGRPVKWLGDGVMLHFPDPGPGVRAALQIVAGTAGAGLPPAHAGFHAGPVLFQEGDFYGQTVNVAARIGEYARPGEVLVSQEAVDAVGEGGVTFREIGPVELKGVAGVMRLYAALATDEGGAAGSGTAGDA